MILAEGRKYEALAAGNKQIQQLGMSHTENVHAITRGQTCHNCDTTTSQGSALYTMTHAHCVVTETTGQSAVKRTDDRDSYPASTEGVSHEHATDTKATLTQGKTTNAKMNPALTL